MFPDLTRDDVFRIETRRLWLRWPRMTDAAAIMALAGEREVAEMTTRVPHPYPPEAADAYVIAARRAAMEGESLTLALAPKAQPTRLIGMIGIRGSEAGEAELGYWIGRPHWGKGLATEAARAVVDAFFAYTENEALIARARVINPASRRVIEKCGFTHEGPGFVDGLRGRMPVDTFRLTRRDWASLKAWSREGFAPSPVTAGALLETDEAGVPASGSAARAAAARPLFLAAE